MSDVIFNSYCGQGLYLGGSGQVILDYSNRAAAEASCRGFLGNCQTRCAEAP